MMNQVKIRQNRNIILSVFVGIVFSGAALYVSFRNVPLAQLLGYMQTINIQWIIPSILIGLSSYLFKVFRWQVILSPLKSIRFWHAYHPLVIAFMINCVLPGRVGELARPAILYRRDKVEFSKGLATVGVERLFDLFALLLLFIIIMSNIDINTSLSLEFNGYQINRKTLQGIWSGMVKAGVILMLLIIMLMLPATRYAVSRLISWIPRLLLFTTSHFRDNLARFLQRKTQSILDNLAMGFEVLKSPMKIITCLMLSLTVWLLVFASFYVLTLGCKGVNLSFLQASAVTTFICFFIILPSVPGFWGMWEIGGIYGLMLFEVPKVLAAGIALAFHFFQIIPIILLGILSAWLTGVNILQSAIYSQKSIGEQHNSMS